MLEREVGRLLGSCRSRATFPSKCEVRFVAAEGTDMDSMFGGVYAFFLCVTADVPAATDGLGRFWNDEVSVERTGIHGAVVFKCREFALTEGVTDFQPTPVNSIM